jgi:hypothetical protein
MIESICCSGGKRDDHLQNNNDSCDCSSDEDRNVFCAPCSEAAYNTREVLLKNQVALGDNYSNYFGVTQGAAYAELLSQQQEITLCIIQAIIDGRDFSYYSKRWYRNKENIILFLTTDNPALSVNELNMFFDDYLSTVISGTELYKNGNYAASSDAYANGQIINNDLSNYIADKTLYKFGVY